MVVVQNLLVPFCCVLEKVTLQHFSWTAISKSRSKSLLAQCIAPLTLPASQKDRYRDEKRKRMKIFTKTKLPGL